jgi:3-oxoacyl-[acyl-carrier-protein] synthase-3
MRYDDVYIAGTGAWHPKTVPVDEAIADGRYDLAVQRRTGQQRVAVAETETVPEMAVLAGQQALERSGLPPERFSLLLHAVATHNGLEAWSAASFVQDQVLGGHGFAYEIHQHSNGAVGALELACGYLMASPDRPAAMITAADQFAPPRWDRWRSAPLLVYADGASAVVLARGTGFARVVTVASVADAALEGLHRGHLSFSPDATNGYPVSIGQRILEFTERTGVTLEDAKVRMADTVRRATATACAEADMGMADAQHVVSAHLGRELLYDQVLDPLGVDIDRSTWRLGAQIGHAGAADQFVGLNHLVEEEKLTDGDRVLVVGLGGGFNATTAVLEIVRTGLTPSPIEVIF